MFEDIGETVGALCPLWVCPSSRLVNIALALAGVCMASMDNMAIAMARLTTTMTMTTTFVGQCNS